MAQKRMFNKSITNDDNFLDMPMSSQVLYFHLSMNADDDGFVNNWKSIMRITGTKDDDLKVLIAKQYIIPFDSGVIVIKHWRLNNYLQKDRIIPTQYQEELKQLQLNKNNVYEMDTNRIHSIDKNRIVKNRLVENREDTSRSKKPTLEEVKEYSNQRGNKIDYRKFYDYYEANNWTDSKGNKVKSWKQKMITWESHQPKKETTYTIKTPDWFDKTIETSRTTSEEQQELDNILKEIGG